MRVGTGWGEAVVQGVVGAARTARRSPGFTIGVVLTLGLGIGANATMYGIIDRLLLQPPAHITQPDQVRQLLLERPGFTSPEPFLSQSLTYPDYEDFKEHSGMDVAGFTRASPITVGRGGAVAQASGALASASFFTLTGVSPRMGRFFSDEETRIGADLTVVLSEEYWDRAWGRDPGVLGQSVEVRGVPARVIGVAPEGFTGVALAPVDLWLPLEPTQVIQDGGTGCIESRGCWWLWVVARLHDGVDVAAAEAEAQSLHHNKDDRPVLTPVIAAAGPTASPETRVARWLAGVSAIVLLIACFNVANLLMARATGRRREVAVRRALGATTRRIAAQDMFESLALAVVGGALALAIARWGGWFVRSTLLPGVYFPNEAWSGRLVVFTAVAAAVAGLIAGLPPVLEGLRSGLVGAMNSGGRGASSRHSPLRSGLTVLQAALSVVLLVGAGLFVRSLGELRSLDLGMDMEQLALVRLELTDAERTVEETRAIYEDAQRRVAAVPGVQSTSLTSVPFQWGFAMNLEVPGLDSLPRLPGGGPYYFGVTDAYFETVGVSILRGRALTGADGASSERVVVVSETMAASLWPSDDALGQCLLLGSEPEGCTTVVGIAEDAARGGYQDEAFMGYYLPAAQIGQAPRAMYVRSTGAASEVVNAVAVALRGASPEVRFADVQPLRQMLDPGARSWTLGATMFSIFGLLALVLAAIGLYGVLAFDVAQRTRELGVRAALGASRERLLTSVLLRGARLAGFGLVVGLGAAWLVAPRVAGLLFEVSPRDPVVLVGVAASLAAVCLGASLVPGLRATHVQPTEALAADQV